MRVIKINNPKIKRRRLIWNIFLSGWLGLMLWLFLLEKSASQFEVEASEVTRHEATEEEAREIQKLYIKKVKIDREHGWKKYLESLNEPQELKDWMYRIIECESRGDPLAENQTHVIVGGVDYGTAKGLFQILDETWTRWGCEGSVWNEYDAVDCAIKAYKMGRQSEWACNSLI